MSGRLFLIIRISIIMAVIALAIVGTIYVLDVVENKELRQVLGKVFALLGIYTGCALALTLLTGAGAPGGGAGDSTTR